MPALPPAVADGQIILSAWGNAVRLVLLSGLGRFTRRGQILVASAPLESAALNPPTLADSPALLRMTSDGDPSYLPVADLAPGVDSITARELAPGSVDAAALQTNAVTRPKLADRVVGTAEVENNVITAPKLSAAVRESIADVEGYARPSQPAALVPITRIDTRSLYMAGPGALPSAANTSDGDILIRIDTEEASDGLGATFPGDVTFVDSLGGVSSLVLRAGQIYVADTGTNAVEAYAADGTRVPNDDFAVGSNLLGLTDTGSRWVVVRGTSVRFYTYSGVYDAESFGISSGLTKIIFFNNRLYLLHAGDREMAAYSLTGTRIASEDIIFAGGNAFARDFTVANDTLFVLDPADNYVYAYGTDGGRVPASEFPIVASAIGLAFLPSINRLGVFTSEHQYAYNLDGSRYRTLGSYVDRVSARLYLSDGSAWTEVTSISGIHGGGGGGGGISLATAQAVAAAAARAVFTGAFEAKLQGIETSATRDQSGAELVAAITGAIGAAWQDAGVTLSQLASAVATHDGGALNAVHVSLVGDHNLDADAHPGLLGATASARMFSGDMSYTAASHLLTGLHAGQVGVAARADLFWGSVPLGLAGDASIAELTLQVDQLELPLSDADGVPVAARQLQDHRLYPFFAGATRWQIATPLVFPSPVAEYPRYGLFTGDSTDLPAAAAFLGGAVWMAQQSYGDASVRTASEYYWIADRRADLGVIAFGVPSAPPNLLANARFSLYPLDPESILIGGVQYYAYRSAFKLNRGFINYDYQVILRPA